MVVQEVYIGRISEIEALFNQLSLVRELCVNKKSSLARNIDKLEKMVEDFWGFKAFSFKIIETKHCDAYSIPVCNALDIDPNNMFISVKTGYRFIKEAKVASMLYISKGCMLSNMTNEELFAVFLHEIGHSFVQRSPAVEAMYETYKKSALVALLFETLITALPMYWMNIFNVIRDWSISFNATRKLSVYFKKVKNKIPIIRNISTDKAFAGLNDMLSDHMYKVFTPGNYNAYKNQRDKIIKKRDKDIKAGKEFLHNNPYGRAQERLADDFATIYGFGPQLGTVLLKIENPDNQTHKYSKLHSKEGHEKYDKVDALANEINGLLDVHPGTVDRILAVIESLEHEYENNKELTPKMKQEVKDNLYQLKALITDIKEKAGVIAQNKNEYYKALYQQQANDGNTEDSKEKKFFDRSKIDKDFEKRFIPEDASLLEDFNIDENFDDIWVED